MSRSLTPAATRSLTGNLQNSIAAPYASVGSRMRATFQRQSAGESPTPSRASIESTMIPPSTSPPGQPACRMLSHFVFSRGNSVATTGLMTASTAPLPSATMKLPAYNAQYAPRLVPPASASPNSPGPKIVTAALARWQTNANAIALPYPIRSITSENRMMLMANGQRPTPNSSPFSVSVSP